MLILDICRFIILSNNSWCPLLLAHLSY